MRRLKFRAKVLGVIAMLVVLAAAAMACAGRTQRDHDVSDPGVSL